MGLNWYETFPAGTPTFRLKGMIAYDRVRGRLVMYGGLAVGESFPGTDLRTWELYGGSWNAVTTTNQPKQWGPGPAKTRAPWEGWMVYDEVNEVCVLHFDANSGGSSTCETWTYDGTDWTDTGATTPNRGTSAAVWDPVGEQVVMWGGALNRSLSGAADYSYYTWDGSAWTTHTTANAPVMRDQHGLAYDIANDVIVMFGGYTGVNGAPTVRPDDTWTIDPNAGTPDWTQESPANNPTYYQLGEGGEIPGLMVYAEDIGKTLICSPGGVGAGISSTWTYDGTDWEAVLPDVEPVAAGGMMSWEPEYNRTIYYGGGGSPYTKRAWLFPRRRFVPQIYRRL